MDPRHAVMLFTIVTAALAPASPICGQHKVLERVSCSYCSINVEHVVDLGRDASVPDDGAQAIRGPNGLYYMWNSYGRSILVFDSLGGHVGEIGPQVQGLDSLTGVGAIAFDRAGLLHLFDQPTARHVVMDSASIKVHRTGVPVYNQVVVLPDESVVTASSVRTAERIGLPLHLLDATGRVVRSFGSTSGLLRPDLSGMDERSLANSTRGVWAAFRPVYVVERWNLDNTFLGGIERKAPWFPNRLARNVVSVDHPPSPRIQAINEDQDGRLWVAIWVADAQWKSAVKADPNGNHDIVVNINDYVDTIIEVFDVDRGQLLASRRITQVVVNFAGDGLVTVPSRSNEGMPVLGIWRVAINHIN